MADHVHMLVLIPSEAALKTSIPPIDEALTVIIYLSAVCLFSIVLSVLFILLGYCLILLPRVTWRLIYSKRKREVVMEDTVGPSRLVPVMSGALYG